MPTQLYDANGNRLALVALGYVDTNGVVVPISAANPLPGSGSGGGSGTTTYAKASAASSLVVKGAAGSMTYAYALPTATGWLTAIDATAAPSSGATITPSSIIGQWPCVAGQQAGGSYTDAPIPVTLGLVLIVSSSATVLHAGQRNILAGRGALMPSIFGGGLYGTTAGTVTPSTGGTAYSIQQTDNPSIVILTPAETVASSYISPIPSYALAEYSGNDLSLAAAFDTWLNRQADLQTVFFNQTTWANFDSSIDFIVNLFGATRCVWSVPLAAAYGTIPEVVAGSHDSTFQHCASAILAKQPGHHPILIRTGWEFNLLSQEQRAFDNSSTPVPIPTAWVNAYRRVIGIFRAASPRFRFIWCPNTGDATYNGLTVTDCYPGDAYVDLVGIDLYFDKTYDSDSDGGTGVFGYRKGQGTGLDWLVGFANTHGKPWCIPEWGVNSNLAVNYMDSFCAYLRSNKCSIHGYWNSNAAFVGKLSDEQYPALSPIYKRYFSRPTITSANSFAATAGSAFPVSLTSNQTVTWSIVSGVGATLSGSTLTFASKAGGGASSVTVRAVNADGYAAAADQVIQVTFAAAYAFANTEAAAIVNAMTTPPTETRKPLIDNFVGSLKSAGIWSVLDTMHVMAAHTSQAALLNWLAPAGVAASVVNTPVFTVDRGFTGHYDGSTPASITTNISGTRSGNKFTLNSASMAVWALTSASDSGSDIGNGTGTGGGNAYVDSYVGGKASGSINDYTALQATVTTGIGLTAINRSGATARQLYKNGAQVASDAQATSGGVLANSFVLLTDNPAYPPTRQIALGFVGGSLTSSQETACYNAGLAYLQGVGAA